MYKERSVYIYTRWYSLCRFIFYIYVTVVHVNTGWQTEACCILFVILAEETAHGRPLWSPGRRDFKGVQGLNREWTGELHQVSEEGTQGGENQSVLRKRTWGKRGDLKEMWIFTTNSGFSVFRSASSESGSWTGRPSSVSRSQRCLRRPAGVEQTWSEVRWLRVLLPKQALIWKLPASVFPWSSAAERSTDEGRRLLCGSEQRHHRRHRHLRVSGYCHQAQWDDTLWDQAPHQPDSHSECRPQSWDEQQWRKQWRESSRGGRVSSWCSAGSCCCFHCFSKKEKTWGASVQSDWSDCRGHMNVSLWNQSTFYS